MTDYEKGGRKMDDKETKIMKMILNIVLSALTAVVITLLATK